MGRVGHDPSELCCNLSRGVFSALLAHHVAHDPNDRRHAARIRTAAERQKESPGLAPPQVIPKPAGRTESALLFRRVNLDFDFGGRFCPTAPSEARRIFLWNRGEASKPNEFEWVSSVVDVAIMAVAISRDSSRVWYVRLPSKLARSLTRSPMHDVFQQHLHVGSRSDERSWVGAGNLSSLVAERGHRRPVGPHVVQVNRR